MNDLTLEDYENLLSPVAPENRKQFIIDAVVATATGGRLADGDRDELTAREKHLLALAIVTFAHRNRKETDTMVRVGFKLNLRQQIDDIDPRDIPGKPRITKTG